ncbi:MAG: prephenate dehydratase, partial [Candidatus Omnitrophica bacterium]|nr:prephenate dehydratase [Candidatus Omnitrophota bacterium]
MSKLIKLRKQIDQIDNHLLELLNQRAVLASQIGRTKLKAGLKSFAPERESKILERLARKNKGPLKPKIVNAVFNEIISGSRSMEKPLQIGYLGPAASFTHQASLEKFGSSADYIACDNIADIFAEVEKEHADYGVVPIENSIEGAVSYTLDMFVNSTLLICSEIYLEISHNLISRYPMPKIKKVFSNPQVFGQCKSWLRSNLPQAELITVSSTTRAAQEARRHQNSAAIASLLAAREYRLNVIHQAIEDSPHNVTRFLVIGKQSPPLSDRDKTSIMFSIKDKVGALHDVLVVFKKNKINLTKI